MHRRYRNLLLPQPTCSCGGGGSVVELPAFAAATWAFPAASGWPVAVCCPAERPRSSLGSLPPFTCCACYVPRERTYLLRVKQKIHVSARICRGYTIVHSLCARHCRPAARCRYDGSTTGGWAIFGAQIWGLLPSAFLYELYLKD